jgi:hypothetical protein
LPVPRKTGVRVLGSLEELVEFCSTPTPPVPLWLKKTLWASFSLILGLSAGVICLPIGMLIVAAIFTIATHGRDEGLGAGLIISWYGLMLGVAIGTATTILLTRWLYNRRISN